MPPHAHLEAVGQPDELEVSRIRMDSQALHDHDPGDGKGEHRAAAALKKETQHAALAASCRQGKGKRVNVRGGWGHTSAAVALVGAGEKLKEQRIEREMGSWVRSRADDRA